MNLLKAIASTSSLLAPCSICGGILFHSYTSIGVPLLCSECHPIQKHRVKCRKVLVDVAGDGVYLLIDMAEWHCQAAEARLPPATAADFDPETPLPESQEDFEAWWARTEKVPPEERVRMRAEAIAARGGEPESKYEASETAASAAFTKAPPGEIINGDNRTVNENDKTPEVKRVVPSAAALIKAVENTVSTPALGLLLEKVKMPNATPEEEVKSSKKKPKKPKFITGQKTMLDVNEEYD